MTVKIICVLSLIALILSLIAYNYFEITVPEEFLYDTGDFVRKYGYECDTHTVKTEDHFLLTIYRMKKPNAGYNPDKRAILWMGGFLSTSEILVFMGRGEDLAYDLVDEGFDVWLCNRRGLGHSKPENETNTHPNDIYYPTLHEAIYDIPAMVDYILKQNTNFNNLIYFGTSSGTVELLLTLSMRPEYNQKIRTGFLFSPSTYCTTHKWYHRALFNLLKRVERFLSYMNNPMVFNRSPTRAKMAIAMCKNSVLGYLCAGFLKFMIRNADSQNFTANALGATYYLSGYIVGYTKNVLHNDPNFMAVDWGREENLRRYKSETPPVYNLTNVRAPMRVYYVEDDVFIPPECTLRAIADIFRVISEVVVLRNMSHVHLQVATARFKHFSNDVLKAANAL